MSTSEPSSEYFPRVTKSLIKGPEPDYSKVDSFRFKDSDTLLCVIRGLLHISFDNGGNWEIPNEFKDRLICFVGKDPFHKTRAFVTSEGGKSYVTEDQGKTWTELYFPKESNEHVECLGVRTHPTDMRLLLFYVDIEYDKKSDSSTRSIYASDNAGKSIRRIAPPVNHHETAPTSEDYDCHFAVSSKESTLDHTGIYCIHKATYPQNSCAAEDAIEEEVNICTLFYTADFGKTTKVFDELNGFFLDGLFTFASAVIVLASKGQFQKRTRSLWISQGEHFELVHLPDEVVSSGIVYLLPLCQDLYSGYDQKRLLLNVRIKDCKDNSLLVLDLPTLNFSKYPEPSSDNASEYFGRLGKLKKILGGQFYLNPYPEQADHSATSVTRFHDSDTVIFILDGFLHISFNNGESWQAVDEFKEGQVRFVRIDQFHEGRAFVNSEGGEIYVTEDQGGSWKKLDVPKTPKEDSPYPSRNRSTPLIYSHPIDRKLLLLHVSNYVNYSTSRCSHCMTRTISFVSDNAGQSFRPIIAPPAGGRYQGVAPICEYYDCSFAVSSKESTLENNGIYFLHHATYAQDLDSKEPVEDADKYALFYTSDFGKTTRTFDEFNGSSVEKILVFPSNVFVLTSEGNEENRKLWISKGESFKPVSLPDEVISLEEAYLLREYDPKQLFLSVRVKGEDDRRMLVLDTSNMNFSLRDHTPCTCGACFGQLDNLKGTFWENNPWEPLRVSFDAGRSWTKNLRVVDPTGKLKRLFEGDIEDVGNYSFDGDLGIYSEEPTAGILLDKGAIQINGESRNEDDMTFISRDGGLSWEIAFEFPVRASFLDFGNIIIAMHEEDNGAYTKFLFSLDQGRTWNEYHLEEPVSGHVFCIRSFGLKALIGIIKKTVPAEHLFYALDFSNIFGGTPCTEDDLERWYLYDGKYIDGVRYSFDRRRPDAKCLVRKTFKDLKLHEERES